MGDTPVLFIKIERLRRLYRAERIAVSVARGPDGTFGLGLTDDNEVSKLHSETNAGLIFPGDQVLEVDGVGLGRDRLSAVLSSAAFAERRHVTLHVSRKRAAAKDEPISGDVFATLKLLRADGATLQEYPSDIWPARTDAAWGACWTVRCPRGAAAASLTLHRSHLFTDPVVGTAPLPFDETEDGEIRTGWHGFRPEPDRWVTRAVGAAADAALHGEALLSVRKYLESSSVCPRKDSGKSDQRNEYGWDSADEFFTVVSPQQHRPEPLSPIAEPPIAPPL
jgi:hypothetical protein